MPDRYVRPTGDMHIPKPRRLPPPIPFVPASIDGHPLPETTAYLLPEAPGLCYHSSPGGCGRWTISHRASRCRVLDVVGPVSQVEAEMRRLAGLADWTQAAGVLRAKRVEVRDV